MSDSVTDLLKKTFATADQISSNDLARLYAPDVVFADPLGRVEGLKNLTRYFNAVYENVRSCRFEYIDELIAENRASIKWDMTFRHSRLRSGKEITVRGVSLIEYSDKVSYHEDIYDVGALIYENVPLLSWPVRWLKRRAHDVAAPR